MHDGGWVSSGGVDDASGPFGFANPPNGISALEAGVVWGVSDLVFADASDAVRPIFPGAWVSWPET